MFLIALGGSLYSRIDQFMFLIWRHRRDCCEWQNLPGHVKLRPRADCDGSSCDRLPVQCVEFYLLDTGSLYVFFFPLPAWQIILFYPVIMTRSAFMLPVGRILTIVPMKYVFLASIAIFEFGSLLCAAAPTISVLIGGRAVAGCAAAG